MSRSDLEEPTPYWFTVAILREAVYKGATILTIRLEDPNAPDPRKYGFDGKTDAELWMDFALELKRAEYRGEDPEAIIHQVLVEDLQALVESYKADLQEEACIFSQKVTDRTRGVVVLHDGTPYRCFKSSLFPHVSSTLERLASFAAKHGIFEEFRYVGQHREWILVFGNDPKNSLQGLLELNG